MGGGGNEWAVVVRETVPTKRENEFWWLITDDEFACVVWRGWFEEGAGVAREFGVVVSPKGFFRDILGHWIAGVDIEWIYG